MEITTGSSSPPSTHSTTPVSNNNSSNASTGSTQKKKKKPPPTGPGLGMWVGGPGRHGAPRKGVPKTWILGKAYDVGKRSGEQDAKSLTESLFRFTYRRDFTPLAPYNTLTSDAGWGCMLRAAQMMMGHTLKRHYLGKDWRLPRQKEQNLFKSADYCNLVRWFSDHPGYPHIYAIHHMLQCGMKYDKLPGEWYGPSTAALVLRDLTHLHRVKYGGQVEVLVTQGDTIYVTEVEQLCSNLSLNDCLLGIMTEGTGAGVDEGVGVGGADVKCDKGMLACIDDAPQAAALNEFAVSPDQTAEAPGRVAVKCPERLPRQQGRLDEQQPQYHRQQGSTHSLHDLRATAAAVMRTVSPPLPSPPRPVNNDSAGRASLDKALHSLHLKEPSSVPSSSSQADHMHGKPSHEQQAGVPQRVESALGLDVDPFFDPLFRPPPAAVAPWSHALMVIIPLRLGIQSVNPEYIEELKEVLRHPNCVGIIGGRPHHAMYFTGYQGSTLMGLDPHTVFPTPPILPLPQTTAGSHPCTPIPATATAQSSLLPSQASSPFPWAEYISQVHVSEFVTLELPQLDPSLAIGLYFEDRAQFEGFCDSTRKSVEEKLSAGRTPLYAVQHSPPSFTFGEPAARKSSRKGKAPASGMNSDGIGDRGTQGRILSGELEGENGGTGDVKVDECSMFDMPEDRSVSGAAPLGGDDDADEEYVFI